MMLLLGGRDDFVLLTENGQEPENFWCKIRDNDSSMSLDG